MYMCGKEEGKDKKKMTRMVVYGMVWWLDKDGISWFWKKKWKR